MFKELKYILAEGRTQGITWLKQFLKRVNRGRVIIAKLKTSNNEEWTIKKLDGTIDKRMIFHLFNATLDIWTFAVANTRNESSSQKLRQSKS